MKSFIKRITTLTIPILALLCSLFSPALRCYASVEDPDDIVWRVNAGYWSPAEAAVCWAYTYPDIPCPYGTPADYGITIKGSGGSSASASSTSGGSSAPKKASKPAGPTYSDFSDGAHQYVVTHKKALYDTYNKGRNEVGSVVKDTEVSVLGESSNGFYHINYTAEDGTAVDGYLYYEGKDNIVTKEEYDKAWEVTNTKDATCEKDGKVTETNALSNGKRYTVIPATGHTESEWQTKVEPSFFKDGEQIKTCTTCNKTLQSEVLPSTMKKLGWKFPAAIVAAVSVLFLLLFGFIHHKKKADSAEVPTT